MGPNCFGVEHNTRHVHPDCPQDLSSGRLPPAAAVINGCGDNMGNRDWRTEATTSQNLWEANPREMTVADVTKLLSTSLPSPFA